MVQLLKPASTSADSCREPEPQTVTSIMLTVFKQIFKRARHYWCWQAVQLLQQLSLTALLGAKLGYNQLQDYWESPKSFIIPA